MDNSYMDIRLNLEQYISVLQFQIDNNIENANERQNNARKALELYETLIQQYPEFARAEKSSSEGFFSDIEKHDHLKIPYLMKTRLER